MLDEWNGFHSHTTWSTVTTHHALEMLAPMMPKNVYVVGCTRPYTTRHGAGPLPSESNELTKMVLESGDGNT